MYFYLRREMYIKRIIATTFLSFSISLEFLNKKHLLLYTDVVTSRNNYPAYHSNIFKHKSL